MDLYINGEKTLFELENEKNAFEIIMSLSDILSKTEPKQFITKINIDEKEYSYAEDEKLISVILSDVKNIEIETSDIFGITILSFKQIEEFLKLLSEIFSNNIKDDSLESINEYISWMKQGINQIVKLFYDKDNELKEELEFYKNCESLINVIKDNENVSKQAMEIITDLRLNLAGIKNILIHSFKLPDKDFILENLKTVIKNIEMIIPQFENIPILFQSGEDKESMIIIHSLTEILEKSINLFVLFKETFKLHMDKYTVKEVTFEEFFKTITNHLKQLMDAMQNSDSVLISDLLEYEFVPNLNEIKSILLKIEEEAFNKIN